MTIGFVIIEQDTESMYSSNDEKHHQKMNYFFSFLSFFFLVLLVILCFKFFGRITLPRWIHCAGILRSGLTHVLLIRSRRSSLTRSVRYNTCQPTVPCKAEEKGGIYSAHWRLLVV